MIGRLGLGTVALAVIAMGSARAQNAAADVSRQVPIAIDESAPVTPHRFDGDVRALAAPVWKRGDPIREIPRRSYPKPGAFPIHEPESADRLVQQQQQASQNQPEGVGGTFTTPSRSFSGIGFTGVTPPDPTGAIGEQQAPRTPAPTQSPARPGEQRQQGPGDRLGEHHRP